MYSRATVQFEYSCSQAVPETVTKIAFTSKSSSREEVIEEKFVATGKIINALRKLGQKTYTHIHVNFNRQQNDHYSE